MATTAPASDHRSVSGGLARAAVFGINDGLISNVSLVIGFAGSGVSSTVVRLAGVAGAIAGAASMAAGEWVSVTAQNDLVRRELELEKREIAVNTKKETQELAAYYRSHGMSAEQAMRSALEVMQDPEVALLVHAREEFGLDPTELPSPVKVGQRIRGNGQIVAVEPTKDGALQSTLRLTVEVEGQDKPACVVDTVSRYYF